MEVDRPSGLAQTMHNRGDFGDRLDDPCLVIGMHHRDQDGFGPQMALQFLGAHSSGLIHSKVADRNAFALELAKRFQHSRVLDLGCNGVLPVTRKRLYETEDRKIVRFRSSTRENEFRGRYSQESCDASPCVLDGLPRALAFAMGAGWVSEHLPQRKVY